MTANQDIGIVGLGAMGLGMAQSLRRAGYRVHACDVRPEAARAFAAEGGVACVTPAEAAAASELLISAVVNAAQTEAVLFGEGGAAAALKPGSVFVMCSTVDPNWSIDLERRLAERDVLYLDAPMSGRRREGGGRPDDDDDRGSPRGVREGRCRARRDGRQGLPARRPGRRRQQGQDHQPAARRRAHRSRCRGDGARPARRRRPGCAVRGHHAQRRQQLDVREPHGPCAGRDYTPLSAVDIFVKDLGLVLDTARATKFPLPLASTAHQMFMQASTAGFAREDDAAVIKIFPGIELPAAKKTG
jgi:3-hydroxyisobutyrate dehydrogenase